MSRRWRIRKGDKVIVISGRNKGTQGVIEKVLRSQERVVIKGVNVVKKHIKPSANHAGGIEEKEMSIHVSNVMHVDPESGVRTRVGSQIVEEKKVRVAKKSGAIIK